MPQGVSVHDANQSLHQQGDGEKYLRQQSCQRMDAGWLAAYDHLAQLVSQVLVRNREFGFHVNVK